MSLIIFPANLVLEGSSPFSISLPNKLHTIRLKYSCRGKDKKERESVVIPINRGNNPKELTALSRSIIPSSVSKNHQAGPNCILPGIFPSANAPVNAAKEALSLGLLL